MGVSVPTISEWLNILEITAQIILVPPFYENFGKRLIKSPKLYFADSGLVCHLLGIDSEKTLKHSPFLGAVFEGYIAAEIVKSQINAGRSKALYYFRDQQGLEVDFLVPSGHQEIMLIEAKASQTVTHRMTESIQRLRNAISQYSLKNYVVYNPGKTTFATSALHSVIRAVSIEQLTQVHDLKIIYL